MAANDRPPSPGLLQPLASPRQLPVAYPGQEELPSPWIAAAWAAIGPFLVVAGPGLDEEANLATIDVKCFVRDATSHHTRTALLGKSLEIGIRLSLGIEGATVRAVGWKRRKLDAFYYLDITLKLSPA